MKLCKAGKKYLWYCISTFMNLLNFCQAVWCTNIPVFKVFYAVVKDGATLLDSLVCGKQFGVNKSFERQEKLRSICLKAT